jgi:hypothetical protein
MAKEAVTAVVTSQLIPKKSKRINKRSGLMFRLPTEIMFSMLPEFNKAAANRIIENLTQRIYFPCLTVI